MNTAARKRRSPAGLRSSPDSAVLQQNPGPHKPQSRGRQVGRRGRGRSWAWARQGGRPWGEAEGGRERAVECDRRLHARREGGRRPRLPVDHAEEGDGAASRRAGSPKGHGPREEQPGGGGQPQRAQAVSPSPRVRLRKSFRRRHNPSVGSAGRRRTSPRRGRRPSRKRLRTLSTSRETCRWW